MWKQITRGGGAALLLGFFLPWVAISCNAPTDLRQQAGANLPVIRFTGYQLATGTTINGQQLPASPGLWLVPLAAVAAVVITSLLMTPKIAAVSVLVAALLGAGPILSAWQSFEAQRGNAFISVETQIGLWISLLGLLGLAASGVLGLTESPADSRTASNSTRRPPAGARQPAGNTAYWTGASSGPPYAPSAAAARSPAPNAFASQPAPRSTYGQPWSPPPLSPLPMSSVTTPSTPDLPNAICPNPVCRRPIKPGQVFCGACGQRLAAPPVHPATAPPAATTCPNPACGRSIKPGQVFCGACGQRLAAVPSGPVQPVTPGVVPTTPPQPLTPTAGQASRTGWGTTLPAPPPPVGAPVPPSAITQPLPLAAQALPPSPAPMPVSPAPTPQPAPKSDDQQPASEPLPVVPGNGWTMKRVDTD